MNRILRIWVTLASMLAPLWVRCAEPAASAYYELRLYTVSSNKMDAVQARFRDTVEPVRRKHGIRTLAYWTAPGPRRSGTFAYLLAASSEAALRDQERQFGADPEFQAGYAASKKEHGETVDRILSVPLTVDPTARFELSPSAKPRVFELRIYSVLPGKLAAFRNRWRDHAIPIYRRHHLDCLGWWVAATPNSDGQDRFVCLLAGESVASIQASITAFHQDPEWIRVEMETEAQGPLRSDITIHRWTPTSFSPLR